MRHCTQCGAPTPDDARFCPRCGAAVAAAASSDASLGQVIADRYQLVEKIGQGGSGTIYRGEHTTLRKRVAVKILHAQLSADDRAIERFRREATTVAELDNDHILQVLDFGRTDDNRLFFAMEYLEGEPLTKLIERDKWLTVPRTIDILGQIAEALMEAHSLGYIHRDLRPRNVFLTTKRGRTDFVKLLDFGLSKLIVPNSEAKHTAMGMTFGDPRYMSPEQARGETLDRRSDIYSLGAIAFEMLVGTPPYTGSGTFEILQQHLDAPVPSVRERRADCPEWLDAVVRRALAKKPGGRFLTVAQLIECLRAESAPPVLDAAEQAAHAKLSSEGARDGEEAAEAAPVASEPSLKPMVKTPGAAVPPANPPAAASAPVAAPSAPVAAPSGSAPVAAAAASSSSEASVPPASSVNAPPASVVGPKTAPMATALAASLSPPSNPPSVVNALAASFGPPASPSVEAPASPSPRQTQSMIAPKPPVAAMKPAAEGKKAKGDARRAVADLPSAAQSGSVDMTPASTPQIDPHNVPSVVVESSSGERTVPLKPSHLPGRPAPPPADEQAAVAAAPGIEPARKHDRPPTGEWFANEAQALSTSSAVYDDLDEVPKSNRGPIIIAAVAGGLTLIGAIVIALLPKPVHKPLRGEEATASAPTSGAASAAAASAPPANAVATALAPASAAPSEPATPSVTAMPSATASPKTAAPASPVAIATNPPAAAAKAPVAVAPPVAAKPAPIAERPVASAPRPQPAVAARPVAKEPPAHVEKVDSKPKPNATRVAAASHPAAAPAERPTSSAKHDKSVPEGFKDPFATEPTPARSAANESAQADFFIKLGRQKLGASDLSAAATNFNKAREYDPRSADAVAGLGEVAFEQGDYSGAAVHLKQALRLSPNRPRYLVLLGQAYYKLGKPKDAVGEYKKALRADPGNQEAQHSLDLAERKLQSGG